MVILCVGSLIVIYIGISLLRAKTQDLEKDQPTMSIKKNHFIRLCRNLV